MRRRDSLSCTAVSVLVKGALVVAVALVAACSSSPRQQSGDPSVPLPAPVVPRVERLIQGGPNKPYAINGRTYVPSMQDVPLRERGLASWYGKDFHGRRTAMGEVYDMYAFTAAHKTMPLPSYARVRNVSNGRSMVVRVNDRGPFVAGRVIDLSWASARALGVVGLAQVEVERITHEAIRNGRWDEAAALTPQAQVDLALMLPVP